MRQVVVIASQIDPVFFTVVDELDETNRFHIQHCAVGNVLGETFHGRFIIFLISSV